MWVLYIYVYLFAALFYGPPSLEKGFKEATCRSYALTPLIRTAGWLFSGSQTLQTRQIDLSLSHFPADLLNWNLAWENAFYEVQIFLDESSDTIILVCCLKIATFVIVDIWHHWRLLHETEIQLILNCFWGLTFGYKTQN
jgi:hypothetical protein